MSYTRNLLLIMIMMMTIMMIMIMMTVYNSRVMGYSVCQDLQEHKVVHENDTNRELTS